MSGLGPSPYGIAFVSAFVLGYAFVALFLRRRQIPGRVILYSVFFHTFTILYGAKMYSVVTSGFRYTILDAGISSLGGVIGLLTGILVFNRLYPGHDLTFFTAYILAMPLMYSVSKIGCHFAGCCCGIEYHGPFSVAYHNERLQADALFPVQMTESIVFLFVFMAGLLFYRRKQSKEPAAPVGFVMLLCSVCKFSLEYLRKEHAGVVLSANQIVCIVFFLLSLFLLKGRRRGEVKSDPKNKITE